MPEESQLPLLRWTKFAAFTGGVILLGLLSWWWFSADGVDRSRVYRIDYGNDEPFHFRDQDGAPAGLAVDLVRAAAAAKNIRLEWVGAAGGSAPPSPLRVLVTIRTNLAKKLYLTQPYLQGQSSFIVASNSPFQNVSELNGKRISYANYAIHKENLARVLPTCTLVPSVSSQEAMEKLKAGEADAAFMSDYAIAPATRNVAVPFPVRILPSLAPVSRMALAARPEAARVADVLRDGIRDLAVDGRLERIVNRWGFFPNLTTDNRDELIKEKRKVMALQVAAGILLLLVGLSGWLIARLRVEKALARTAELNQSATLDALPAHIALLDTQGVIIAVNKSWRNFAQANVRNNLDFCLGQNYLQVCDEAKGVCSGEAPIAAAGIRAVLRGETGEFSLEYPCHSPAEQRWFRLMVTPLSETGRNGVVVMHINITERKLTELALQASELKARAIVESTPVPMALNDNQRRITFLNRAFVKTFGYTLEDIPTLTDWWPKAYPDPAYRKWVADSWQTELDRARESGGEFRPLELQVRAKDGTDRAVLVAAALLLGAQPSEHLVALIDITERKRQESEREKLELQLRHAQKMQAVGVLAGGIAHDFNNILCAIMSNAFLAGSDLDPAHPAKECLMEIQRAGTRATALVRQILAFSRNEARDQFALDLRPVVEEAVQLLRSTLPAGVELNSRFAAAPMVLADAMEIHRAVINLGTNAWQAMAGLPGKIRLAVEGVMIDADFARTHADLRVGYYARLTVSDTGQGMSSETLEHIFEPFFTTKEIGKGSGLGLAVVHGIIRSHRGAILVQSKPGEGTTFELYFPAAPITHALSPGPAPIAEPASCAGQNQRILLVDDEEPLVRVLAMLLERRQFRVAGFTRAETALAAFQATPDQFDLVITDYNMPGFSGVELARKIHQLRPQTPVLLASGFVTDQLRREAESAGVAQIIGKPMGPDELLQIIHRLSIPQQPPPGRGGDSPLK